MLSVTLLALVLAAPPAVGAEDASAPDYATRVAPLFKKYCAGCHNDEDREGKFSLESYASLQRGTPKGPALLPSDAKGSRIVRLLKGSAKPLMPPEDEPRPSAEEIALIESWIESGARGPQGQEPDRLTLIVPKIAAHASVRPIVALDATADGRWLAVARGAEVGLYAKDTPRNAPPQKTLGSFPGKVTSLHFTPDGARLITASGVAGLGGVAAIWNVADGTLVRKFEGHRDILHDAEAFSPTGKQLATCSYDKKIEIWDAVSGKSLRTLEGHTGAVYDVAFSPDSRFLVSASADDTCKVWRVEDGQRMDTLPQPLKAEYSCAFSPDGRTIVAGGADNNIRVWRFVSREQPGINPMILARFAHEGAIVRLAFTRDGSKLVSLAEDRTIKVWRTSDYSELRLWEHQPDVPTALAFAPGDGSFEVGCMDGSLASFTIPDSEAVGSSAVVAAAKPVEMSGMGAITAAAEHEPNNLPGEANRLTLPARVAGAIAGGNAAHADADYFRFTAKAGEQWVFEVNAARAQSKLDSYLEVLDAQGQRVPRVLLQAVRDSYFTFRGKNDSETDDFRVFNWDEMRINDYLYANGEIVKFWLFPRGPDSGFVAYPGQAGAQTISIRLQRAYTRSGEPCYVVQPHPPGTKLVANGLPVFSLYFENDDDAHRELGKDSRLYFTAPTDGEYLVKVKDVRGFQGSEYGYALTIRARQPDFKVALSGANPTVGAGSAKEFKVSAQRIDGFEGPIRVDIADVPPGFRATTPLLIEAGQLDALGVIEAAAGAKPPTTSATRITATGRVGERDVAHEVNNLGTIKLGPAPKLRVSIGPAEGGPRPIHASDDEPLEFAIEPGQTITLTVKIERAGFNGQVPFGKEGSGRNLPFGVIIDNLGLNGLLVLENQPERVFFVTAEAGTAEQARPFHLTTGAEGGQSSRPVILRVKKPRLEAATAPVRN